MCGIFLPDGQAGGQESFWTIFKSATFGWKNGTKYIFGVY